MQGKRLAQISVSVIVFALLAAGATAAGSETNLRTAKVHPDLVSQLQANPTGGLTAVVTAWNRDGLADIKEAGVVGSEGRVLPMVITSSLTLAQLNKLRESPAVRSVWPEQRYETSMEDTTWITKARYVWSSSAAPAEQPGLNTTGAGVELAMIDTGYDGLHEDGDNLIEFCDGPENPGDRFLFRCTPWVATFNIAAAGLCGTTYPGASNEGPGPLYAPLPAGGCKNKARGDSRDPDVSHGTHVGGTIQGSGDASGGEAANHSTTGMAPDAKFRAYKAGSAVLLNTATIAAYDDMTYKKEQGYSKVVAVNNSWGGGDGANYDSSDPTSVAIKRAYDAGIVSVFAAGNSGPEHNTLSSQCVNPYVVCVAASTKPDSVVMFSSRGRPSQPSDTNRDGVIDGADVQPDNHDRALGQKLELGLYRPTLTAPGVNINSMKAIGANIGSPDSATCREDAPDGTHLNCYTLANGTSMATPHVTGAIGLIVQGYREGHNGKTPTPAQITDILERSANTSKLPANESEEQGAGRLDAYEAVKFARSYPNGLRAANFGHPTPPFEQGQYGKGANAPSYLEKGCTGTASWSVGDPASALDPVGQPPGPDVVLPRYGQHFITVPTKTERLRLTVRWPQHPLANLYVRLWRPGVDPNAEFAGPGQARVYPDQEAVGLVFTGDERWIDVRSPEQTDVAGEGSGPPPAIPSGKWVLRVYHRANGVPATCDPSSQENPKQTEGFNYDVHVELTKVTHQPSVKIDAPVPGTTVGDRFVEIRGRAGYPPDGANDPPRIGSVGHSWEGVTNWEVPGSAGSPGSDENGEPDPSNPRPVLYMHGKADEGCTGNGETDVATCNGPFLLKKSTLSPGAPAFWRTGIDDEVFDGVSDRSIHDPNWSWCLAPGPGCAAIGGDTPLPGTTTVGGAMTVEWWAQCNLCGGLLSADWIIRVWGDGALKFEQRVTATPPDLGLPGRLVKTVTIPTFTATQRIVVHIDPVYVDSQTVTFIYYDSDGLGGCTATGGRCDSLVRMPVGTTGSAGGGGVAAPDNVRVTDLPMSAPYPAAPDVPALRVAWDPRATASNYEVYRSTDPVDLGRRIFRGTGTACTSPEAPAPEPDDAWPGHDRAGLCFTDKGVALRTTYYYRVLSVGGDGKKGEPSAVAYGTPTKYDRQVKVKVDRLYGPQYWEYALLEPSPNPTKDEAGTQWRHLWDTLELTPLQHLIFARSFTQGIGSPKDQTNVVIDDDDGGSTPSCEVNVTQGGWIIAANGDRATFGGNARSDALGNASGQEEYQDHGPAQPLNVHSINVLLITCSQDRRTAHIKGTATINGQGVHQFDIDVTDNGEPGTNDVYRIHLSNGYDSGFQQLQAGNVQIH